MFENNVIPRDLADATSNTSMRRCLLIYIVTKIYVKMCNKLLKIYIIESRRNSSNYSLLRTFKKSNTNIIL